MTPGGSSSPRRIFSFFSSKSCDHLDLPLGALLEIAQVAPRAAGRRRRSSSRDHLPRRAAPAGPRRSARCPSSAAARGRPRRRGRAQRSAPAASDDRASFSSWRMRTSSCRFFSIISISSSSIALARSSFSMPLREKIFTSTTMPSMPGGQMSEASRTSPAFSPKIARSSFSSGVSWVSPFGVTLPTRMSPGLTWAPMRMMPLSSRSRRNVLRRRSGCRA